MMKGAITSEIIGFMLVILTLILFFTVALPKYLFTLLELFGRTSAENVARQLAGLITVSGSSPYKINIDYLPSKDVSYSFEIKNRNIIIKPEFKVSYAEKASSTQPFAVDLVDYGQENVNHFFISKKFDGESSYEFKAKKEE
jgi:hypothetical protein